MNIWQLLKCIKDIFILQNRGNPVGDDMGFRLTGFDDVEIAAISVILLDENMDIGKTGICAQDRGSDNGRIFIVSYFLQYYGKIGMIFAEVSLEKIVHGQTIRM